MDSKTPLVKYSAQLVYFILFMIVAMVILSIFSFVTTITEVSLTKSGINAKSLIQLFRAIFGIGSIFAAAWLSRRATFAFTDYNCYFTESIIVAIKEGLVFLSFLPILGKFFDKQSADEGTQNKVKKIDYSTRFDE